MCKKNKISAILLFLIMIPVFSQDFNESKFDSLKIDYIDRIKDWKAVFREIISERITKNQYDSLLRIYTDKWQKAHESQIMFINRKHPLVDITVGNFENPPLIPSYKNEAKFSQATALNQLCISFKSTNNSYMFYYDKCERSLKNYNYLTSAEYDSIVAYANYFIGEASRFSKYYAECSEDSVFDSEFHSKIRKLPEHPFKNSEIEIEPSISIVKNPILIEGVEGKINDYLKNNYPERANKGGVSGRVRFSFICNNEGLVEDVKILMEKPQLYEFADVTLKAINLLKFIPGKINDLPTEFPMMGAVSFNLRFLRIENKGHIDLDAFLTISPFHVYDK